MFHHLLSQHVNHSVYDWSCASGPFDELLISWNARRPTRGHLAIDVSVGTEWLPYAEWGVGFQRGFVVERKGIRVDQDVVEAPGSNQFQIRVRAENGALLTDVHALHVCATKKSSLSTCAHTLTASTHFPVPNLSQMALDDPRKKRLCSPTSLTALLRFFAPHLHLHPLQIADRVWDKGSDIYGNWVMNVAEGYAQLGGTHFCWVERMSGWSELMQKLPAAISVRGPLLGSAESYSSGHLLVVKGYDAEKQQVLCMDPAFATDAETDVRYPLEELDAAWQRRGRVAYVFQCR